MVKLKDFVIFICLFCLCGVGFTQPKVWMGVRTATDHVPFYLADKLGLYSAEGIPVVVRVLPSNTEIVEGMKRKEFMLGAFPISTAIAAIANGVPIKIIAMTGRGGDGVLVRKEDYHGQMRWLKGKKIGTIRASILDVMLLYALEKEGLDPLRDVECVYFMTLGDMIPALKTKQIDASVNTEPFLTEAENSGWGKVLQYFTKYWPDHPCCVVVAHKELLRDQPELVKRFLKAHIKAVKLANEDLDLAASVIGEYMKGFSKEVIKASLSPSKMKISYELGPDEVMRMAQLMRRYKMIERIPDQKELLELECLRSVIGE